VPTTSRIPLTVGGSLRIGWSALHLRRGQITGALPDVFEFRLCRSTQFIALLGDAHWPLFLKRGLNNHTKMQSWDSSTLAWAGDAQPKSAAPPSGFSPAKVWPYLKLCQSVTSALFDTIVSFRSLTRPDYKYAAGVLRLLVHGKCCQRVQPARAFGRRQRWQSASRQCRRLVCE